MATQLSKVHIFQVYIYILNAGCFLKLKLFLIVSILDCSSFYKNVRKNHFILSGKHTRYSLQWHGGAGLDKIPLQPAHLPLAGFGLHRRRHSEKHKGHMTSRLTGSWISERWSQEFQKHPDAKMLLWTVTVFISGEPV